VCDGRLNLVGALQRFTMHRYKATDIGVPQPLHASLSLRNTGFWNHDILFESWGGEADVVGYGG